MMQEPLRFDRLRQRRQNPTVGFETFRSYLNLMSVSLRPPPQAMGREASLQRQCEGLQRPQL